MHDIFTIGIPVLAILAGILLNRSDVKELRNEMRSELGSVRNEIRSELGSVRGEMGSLRSSFQSEIRDLRSEMNRRFDAVDAKLRYFHGKIGAHEARLDLLEKKQS